MLEKQIDQACKLIQQSTYTVALTGAGVSRPSGIPDFRSPDSGLWQHVNPYEVGSIQGFRYHPEKFYGWLRDLAKTIVEATPNPAHLAFAQLERAGHLKAIITQNIDLLHSKAGSETIYEVHGHIREATCITCFTVYPAEERIKAYAYDEQADIPRCDKCNGVLKPNVILFGEQLPARVMLGAEQETRRADLMIVAGSSLEVYPVADLPRRVKVRGGKLILINLYTTSYDADADLVIHGDVADVLPGIVSRLKSQEGVVDE